MYAVFERSKECPSNVSPQYVPHGGNFMCPTDCSGSQLDRLYGVKTFILRVLYIIAKRREANNRNLCAQNLN